METLPLTLNVVLSAALALVIWTAFFGPPPARRGSALLIAAFASAGLAWFAVGVAGVYHDAPRAGAAIALGVIALSVGRWLAREPAGGEGPDDGPPPADDGPPPPDWDAFERLRRDWARRPRPPSRPREPVA